MRALRFACLALAFTLVACGRSAAPGPATTPATALSAPRAAAASHPSAPKPAESPAAVLKHSTPEETVEDAAGDSGSHNLLLAAVASTVAAAAPNAAAETAPSAAGWQEGVNYTRIVPAQPTDVPPGQVEVLEFFWYACPHCFALDPAIEEWRKTKPAYVTFNRVPVTWSDGHRSLARLFYTLKALGKGDSLHTEIFKAIHVNGNPLVAADPGNSAQTEQIQAAFAAKFGIAESAFAGAYDSMDVSKALVRADELVQRYRIDGVPTFVVNGKYKVDVASAGGPDKLLKLVSDLAAQEHKHQ
jgi:thiol:disulfide interchange protein DsbA